MAKSKKPGTNIPKVEIDPTAAAARELQRLFQQPGVMSAVEQAKRLMKQPEIFSAIVDTQRTVRHLERIMGPSMDIFRHLQTPDIKLQAALMAIRQSDYQNILDTFNVPDFSALNQMMEEHRQTWLSLGLVSGGALVAGSAHLEFQEISERLRSMQNAWCDLEATSQSFQTFTDLQRIGAAIQGQHGFAPESVAFLRDELGDWRGQVAIDDEVGDDAARRTELYLEQGLEPTLTEMPAPAFEETLEVAQIISVVPRPRPRFISVIAPPPTWANEEDHARNSRAYDTLLSLEGHLRNFIDTQMRLAVGERWQKQRVPGNILAAWKEKKGKALDDGTPGVSLATSLIAFADFTDYLPIIVRKDNWDQVFQPIFRRKTNIEESLQRLYPIRITVAHARLITQDDELYLATEVRRILSAIRVL